MSDEGLFPDYRQELENLAENILEIRQQLKEIAAKLGQIERHVNRAFVPVSAKKKTLAQKPKTKGTASAETKPTLSPTQALALFDQLASVYKIDKRRFDESLINVGTADLKLMAYELGITFRNKPSRKVLYATIRSRTNERIMLSENTNVTRLNSDSINASEGKEQKFV